MDHIADFTLILIIAAAAGWLVGSLLMGAVIVSGLVIKGVRRSG